MIAAKCRLTIRLAHDRRALMAATYRAYRV